MSAADKTKLDGIAAGATSNAGTVTSIKIETTSPISGGSTTASTSTGAWTISHANSGATAGSYGDSAAQTPAYGGTFKVPYITVNATGHVTGISEHTVKIPAADNTDTKNTAGSTNLASTKLFLIGAQTQAANPQTYSNESVYISTGNVLMGAAWNDYAEYRQSDVVEPGRCVFENGDDTLSLATERLQRGCEIVSDTFGFAIGETEKCQTPIATSGRVLAYPYEDREEFRKCIGYPVCSGPNGTVSIMTEEEEKNYPSRIIGFVSAVPDYEEWGTGNVKVNNRVWIRIR